MLEARLKKPLLALALLALGDEAFAGETWLVTTVTSYHMDREHGYNEQNFGLGFEYQPDGDEWGRFAGGFYNNSFDDTSVYALYTCRKCTLYRFKNGWKFNVSLGATTGYSHVITPVAVPALVYEGKTFGTNIGIIPSYRLGAPHYGITVIGLQLKMKF